MFRFMTPLARNSFDRYAAPPVFATIVPSESIAPNIRIMFQGTDSSNCFHVSMFMPGINITTKPIMETTVTSSAGNHVPRIHRTGMATSMNRTFFS